MTPQGLQTLIANGEYTRHHSDITQLRYGVSRLRNPLLAGHAFHILPYQGLGTGIPRVVAAWEPVQLQDDQRAQQFKAIVRRTVTAEPQVAPQVTPQVQQLLQVLTHDSGRQKLMHLLDLKDREHFRVSYLAPALQQGLIAMTLPDKPNSRLQQYRLTEAGQQWLATADKPAL